MTDKEDVQVTGFIICIIAVCVMIFYAGTSLTEYNLNKKFKNKIDKKECKIAKLQNKILILKDQNKKINK